MFSLKNFSQLFFAAFVTASTGPLNPEVLVTRNETDILVPKSFGILLYPAYTALDVYGPLESLTIYGYTHTIKLYIIAATMDPVSTRNRMFAAQNSTTNFAVLPTHSFDTVPPIDVLLIPGGLGERSPIEELQSAIDYVARVTPDLQYLLTVCTGAGIAARAGVLDGKFATTNKQAWSSTITRGPKTKWVAKARWVRDGKIWTSSGVQAGMDLMNAFVGHVWGHDFAVSSASDMEYKPNTDARDDPFAKVHNVSSEYDDLVQADGSIKV